AFFADTDKELALLTTAMAKFDQEKILACCHNLKGTSAIFTAQKLITAVKDLESCVRKKNKNKVESAWHNVLAAHESLCATVSCRLTL
ncbi:MAG: Hpt domain-containing protein, partial [Proteobacteria bacterium]|nr:Hpt domain-containing protein [Pseudomonadota bacterium]